MMCATSRRLPEVMSVPPLSNGVPGSGHADVLLRVSDLRVSYAGNLRALHGVCLELPRGGVVAVLGANGAGKTTLLRAVSGTLPFAGGRVDGGSIEFDGQRLDHREPATIVRAGVVQVPEGRQVFEHLTVEE